ncbi:P-loop containing nucleoside triphosphate hydrolase protein [Crepidotus variabilis]|uniref:DNA repair protein RAD50 n=1 Tax=Crepidotus variabilis TaxID=179855 RepID=A0A9P6JUM4_9AGAR|nr:P-loop containing nucleoside triphosphate hydrolase protein [Crepidotus variabilis]
MFMVTACVGAHPFFFVFSSRKNDRESRALSGESERQSRLCHELEKELHRLEKDEMNLQSNLRDQKRLAEDVARMREEIGALAAQSKDSDAKLAEAFAPQQALQERFRQVKTEMDAKIHEAQQNSEDLNRSIDRLNDMNKSIERYVKGKRARTLEDCSAALKESEARGKELQAEVEGVRAAIAVIEKEINESGATISNLRDNIIVRKLKEKIGIIDQEIESYDMEEAAKARRTYEDKYEPAKAREQKLNETYHLRTGELGSMKAQTKTLEDDLKQFKDVYKKYTNQLIKVKVSDMANNDLEKYAKALDNAIMKYHGLKMEEVNDTMKHLWNKTYQGTDIDGIKIVSDVEGGVTKRSYNYRVVMTKDQVEMDMRGRCSAGQKMLASIIIRLALSDSFGQNCGILALDEPTNALDTENIDALAASLVDIINERKTHSNFQLIIITHDENFLRKLGQADVMEYYWSVPWFNIIGLPR